MKYAAAKQNGAMPYQAEEGLVVMNMSFETIGADGGATAILRGNGRENGALAEPALAIPEELRAVLSSANGAGLRNPKKMRIRMGKDAYNCRAFLIQLNEGNSAEPMVILHMQRDSAVTDAIDVVAAEYHLTDREQEALKGIAIGLTSKEMAERMNISPNTVKSFLRIIMLKMGAATRTGIVSKLLEHTNNNHNGANHR